ncbi:hypothetical protein ACHAQE_008891 [Botrytis cinerea]
MSYNHNGEDDLSWYTNQQVSHPIAASTSNDVNSGVKVAASTDTTSSSPNPTKFQAEWPYENSQHVDGSSQDWYSTSDSSQNTHASALLPQMPRSPGQHSSDVNNFDTQGSGELPNVTGLGIYSTPDEILYNPSLQNAFGSDSYSVPQQDTLVGEFLNDCNVDATATGFGTPVPSRYQTDNNLSVGSDNPADIQSSAQAENSLFGTSTQFASSTQSVEVSQQESMPQGEQYQAGFFNGTTIAHPNRPLSAPPAGNWVLEQGVSYTATGLGIQLPLNSLPTATLQNVPLAYPGNWQYDGQSTGPAIDSDVPLAQQSNGTQNASSDTLGDNLCQDPGTIQEAQLQQQLSQIDGSGQNTLPGARQQSDVSSTRSPIRSDRRRHSDPPSVPIRDTMELQQGVQIQSQFSEQAAQCQTTFIDASRAHQQGGALNEGTLGDVRSRRLGETYPVPAQELHTTDPPPTGVRTEPRQISQNQAASQPDRVVQQINAHPTTVPEFHGSQPGVGPHTTFAYPERSHQNTFQQPTTQYTQAAITSGSAKLTEIARPSLQLVTTAPPAMTPQQPTQGEKQPRQPGRQSDQSSTSSVPQSQRVPQRGPPRVQISPQANSPQAQGNDSQPSIPKSRFDCTLPSRLEHKTAAFVNVEPAEDFVKTVSKMPFLDRVACIDRLMREELFKDYLKPHLFRVYNTGREDGLKFALERRSKGPLHGIIETTEINHERQSIKWKTKFDNMQIKNERRKRELAACKTSGGMTTDTSENLGVAPSGIKRSHQTLESAQDSHYEIDDDEMIESVNGSEDQSFVHLRNSPKKPRTSGPASSGLRPSNITDKFCSHAVENIPFLPDPIHSQLRSLSIEQLIIPVQEYINQNGEIADTNVEHWRACAGQAAGTEMEQEMACTHCADHMQDGSVPFASCVIIGATIPAGKHFKGACMNCVYLGKDQDCSLRRGESEETEAQ